MNSMKASTRVPQIWLFYLHYITELKKQLLVHIFVRRVYQVLVFCPVAFGDHYVKMVKVYTDSFCNRNVAQRIWFCDLSFMAISRGITRSQGAKVRHSFVANENSTNNQP